MYIYLYVHLFILISLFKDNFQTIIGHATHMGL